MSSEVDQPKFKMSKTKHELSWCVEHAEKKLGNKITATVGPQSAFNSWHTV